MGAPAAAPPGASARGGDPFRKWVTGRPPPSAPGAPVLAGRAPSDDAPLCCRPELFRFSAFPACAFESGRFARFSEPCFGRVGSIRSTFLWSRFFYSETVK